MKLSCKVKVDEHVRRVCASFDYAFSGVSETEIPEVEIPDADWDAPWSVGLVTGPSGSGKSTVLSKRRTCGGLQGWNPGEAIISQMPDDPEGRLMGVGLNSIPAWCRPYHVLSTGEKFRADLAQALADYATIDEFSSTVDRNVAKSCSAAVARYIRKRGFRNVVFATCHRDVEEWLCPDWVINMEDGERYAPGYRRRPRIELKVYRCGSGTWPIFRKHHYLSEKLNPSSRCFVALWGDTPVAFASALAFPNGNFKNAWREHRTVVLPDFQGLGIGVRMSDFVAKSFVSDGCRYFSKTSHPRMGGYREASPNWHPTSKNRKARPDYSTTKHATKEDGHKMRHVARVCFSHEYREPA